MTDAAKTHQAPYYDPGKDLCATCDKVLTDNAVSSPVLAAMGRFFCDGECARAYVEANDANK